MVFLASAEMMKAVTGLHRAWLASLEAVIGLPKALLASLEVCFHELAKADLSKEIFLYLRTQRGLVYLIERSCLNFLVNFNDQHLSSRPEGLFIALRHYFLIGGESTPQRSLVLR